METIPVKRLDLLRIDHIASFAVRQITFFNLVFLFF